MASIANLTITSKTTYDIIVQSINSVEIREHRENKKIFSIFRPTKTGSYAGFIVTEDLFHAWRLI